MKKRWFLLAIIVAIVFVLSTIIVVQPLFSQSSIVSHDELDGYFLTYLTEYSQLVEENMGLLASGENSSIGLQNLTLYTQRPYSVQGVISSVHGAALFLNRSTTEEFEATDFDGAIEYYVWPSMVKNTTNLKSIRILSATAYYALDTQITADGVLVYIDPGANLIYTGQGHAFSFPKGTGAVIFFGSLIEGNRLILKGSNNVEDWSELQARIDSLDRFLWDCKDILNETNLQTIKDTYTLPLLLERISERMNDGSYKGNPSLLTDDYGELQSIGAPTETLNKVLNDYYEMQSKKGPNIFYQIGSFFAIYVWPLVATVATGIVGGIILYYWTERQKGAQKPNASSPSTVQRKGSSNANIRFDWKATGFRTTPIDVRTQRLTDGTCTYKGVNQRFKRTFQTLFQVA